MRLPSVTEVAAVAGWPGMRSLFRTGWTSFANDRISVYHRLTDVGGPEVEVTTYVEGRGVDRSTASLMLGQMRVHKSPPRPEHAVLLVDGSPVEWSVLRSRSAWVAASEDLDPVITIVGREFPLEAIRLERVALSELAGYDRLTPSAS